MHFTSGIRTCVRLFARSVPSGWNLRLQKTFQIVYTQKYQCHTQVLPRRFFVPRENITYRTGLVDRSEYSDLLFRPENFQSSLKSGDTNLHDVAKRFLRLAGSDSLMNLESDEYAGIRQEIVETCDKLSYQDLLAILSGLKNFPISASFLDEKTKSFWKALDARSANVLANPWSADRAQVFVLLDAWSLFPWFRSLDFSWQAAKKLFRRCDKLTKAEFVMFLFLLNRIRSIPKSLNTYELEYNLNKYVTQLDARELGIASAAFFKTKTPIRDGKLLRTMMHIMGDAAATVEDIYVASFAKLARLSSVVLKDEVLLICDQFLDQVDRLEETACVHMALIGSRHGSVNKKFLEAVVAKCEKNVSKLRLKEMERLALVTAMCSYKCETFWDKIVEELRKPERKNELMGHGRCIPCMLHYFTFQEKYYPDLTSFVLDPSFIKTTYGKNYMAYTRDLVCLDQTMEIEVPEYNGNRLSEKVRISLLKSSTRWVDQEGHERNSLYQSNSRMLKQAVEVAYGCHGKVQLLNVLPQHNSIEVILYTDIDGNPLALPEEYKSIPDYLPKKISNGESRKLYHALTLAPLQGIDDPQPTGSILIKERQIRKCGYLVYRICLQSWVNMSSAERSSQVKSLIQHGLNHVQKHGQEEIPKFPTFTLPPTKSKIS